MENTILHIIKLRDVQVKILSKMEEYEEVTWMDEVETASINTTINMCKDFINELNHIITITKSNR
jgi:hypothetical protein